VNCKGGGVTQLVQAPQEGTFRFRFTVGSLEIFQWYVPSVCIQKPWTHSASNISERQGISVGLSEAGAWSWHLCRPGYTECQSKDESPTFDSPKTLDCKDFERKSCHINWYWWGVVIFIAPLGPNMTFVHRRVGGVEVWASLVQFPWRRSGKILSKQGWCLKKGV
jgi:hypothetical protein